eukprot:TRINITY_DN2434_c0_g1_i1.p1 TRINITY_DN2434_c0_g1~~TRINITY_DN2434_c0_g1_i1.p1  ORF type:complete len:605 (-),score=92.53 TRINITY_DN2434_c0_g1_i1:105-1919(-)
MPRFAGHDPVVPNCIQEEDERPPGHAPAALNRDLSPALRPPSALHDEEEGEDKVDCELLGMGNDLRAASTSAFQEILRLLDEAHHRTMQVLVDEGDALRNSIVEIQQQQRQSGTDDPKEFLQQRSGTEEADHAEVMPFCDKDITENSGGVPNAGAVALWAKLRATREMQKQNEAGAMVSFGDVSDDGKEHRHSLRSSRSQVTPLAERFGVADSQEGSTGGSTKRSDRFAVAFGDQAAPIELPTQDVQERIREFLELPSSSRYARLWSWFWLGLVWISAISPILQVLAPPPTQELQQAAVYSDFAFDILFLAETLLRLFSYQRKLLFLRSPSCVIDILSTLPLIPRCAYGLRMPQEESIVQFLLLFVAPTVRLLKLVRGFQDMFLLFGSVFSLTWEVLRFLLFMLLVIVVAGSTIIFQVEPRSNLPTFGKSIWLSTVTMTTVGYGDIIPESAAGLCLVSVLMVLSVGFIAMPVGILGNAFTQVWSERDRIVIRSKTRAMLSERGYSYVQIPDFLLQYDLDGDGSLTLREFRLMLDDLRVSLDEDRSALLFSSLDLDGDGTVNQQEFVRSLFPYAYHLIYGGQNRSSGLGRRSGRATERKSTRANR